MLMQVLQLGYETLQAMQPGICSTGGVRHLVLQVPLHAGAGGVLPQHHLIPPHRPARPQHLHLLVPGSGRDSHRLDRDCVG